MIRVLQMVGSLDIGGSQAMLMNIYRNIDREKIQFDFVLDHPDQLYFAPEVKALGANIYSVPRFNGRNAGTVMKAWDELLSAHPEYKILHTHVPSYAALFLHVAKKHGLKTLAHGHTASNGSGLLGFVKGIMQYPIRYQTDVMMACSDKAGELLFGKGAGRSEKYVFIPNAVNLEAFKADAQARERIRKELGLENAYVIGHVGRISEAKNHRFLIESFAKLSEKRPDARLLLVGDGELRETVEAQIKSLGLENSVVMTGSRSDIGALMQAMDVFAFPSLWEGLPVTLIEAQAAGLPCIISDTISTDVDVSPLIMRLPITDSELWAQELMKEHEKRDVTDDIIRSGFDIRGSVSRITEIYTELAGEK